MLFHLKGLYKKVKVNKYFILFLIACFAAGYLQEMLMMFLFVTLHELSHVITAVMFKYRIEKIELFPFGGVAKIDNLNGTHIFSEIMISVAGPFSNIMTATILLIFYEAGVNIPYYRYIMNVNIALALFNLMPGLPLDGGRIVRAVLSYYIGFKKATHTAVILGKIVSVILLIIGIAAYAYGDINLSLLLIPFFIFISTNKEEDALIYTVLKDSINKGRYIKNKGAMESLEICAYEEIKARDVIRQFDVNRYHIIIVINSKMEIRSVLTENQIFNGLSIYGSNITLKELCENIKH